MRVCDMLSERLLIRAIVSGLTPSRCSMTPVNACRTADLSLSVSTIDDALRPA